MTLIAGSYYYNVFVMLLTTQQKATLNSHTTVTGEIICQ